MSHRILSTHSLGSFELSLALIVFMLLLSLVALSQPAPANAFLTIVYVRKNGADTPTCGSLVTSPCLTITYAHDKASANQLLNVGPGTYTENITITKSIYIQGAGTGSTIIDGGGAGQVLRTAPSITVSLTLLTIRNGYMDSDNLPENGGGITNFGTMNLFNVDVVSNTVNALGTCTSYCGGGGIFNIGTLTMTNGTVGWNHSESGGGILNEGILYLSGTVIANNASAGGYPSGAGIYNPLGYVTLTDVTIRSNNAAHGAGIRNSYAMTVTASTINSNNAETQAGVWNQGTDAVMTMTNSTVSSNSATAGGGGVSDHAGARLTLNNVTIAANQSPYGNGIEVDSLSSLSIYNSILSNPSNNCDVSGIGVVSHGHNLISDATCPSIFIATGDITNTNPLLSPLANWGGPTQTHGLYPGSPAIDAASPGGLVLFPCKPTDQRGVSRPVGVRCDIGAFEGVLSLADLPFISKH